MKNIAFLALVILFASCSKKNGDRGCWTCSQSIMSMDNSGNVVNNVSVENYEKYCDKTSAEIEEIMEQSRTQKLEDLNGTKVSTIYCLGGCQPIK